MIYKVRHILSILALIIFSSSVCFAQIDISTDDDTDNAIVASNAATTTSSTASYSVDDDASKNASSTARMNYGIMISDTVDNYYVHKVEVKKDSLGTFSDDMKTTLRREGVDLTEKYIQIGDLSLRAKRISSKVHIGVKLKDLDKYEHIALERKSNAGELAEFRRVKMLFIEDVKDVAADEVELTDRFPLPYKTTSYYRVKTVEKDGTIRYYPATLMAKS